MHQQALVFPALPGKTEADVRAIAEEFQRRPDEYRESRDRHGVSLERAYLQDTPMGIFVVAYTESEQTFADTSAELAKSDLPIDRFFRDAVLEVHGFDMTSPPPGPPPETLAAWSDPDVTGRGKGFAFCAPLLPGKADAGRAFSENAYSQPGLAASRRAKNVNKEVVTLLGSPHGDIIAVYAEGKDPFASNAEFASSQDEFDVWFRSQLRELFPPEVDFEQPVPGVTEIFDSAALG